MLERPHHRRIAQVLDALDAPRLAALGVLFGGGTAIALRFGEYRESVDIDFLVSDLPGYRTLRQALTGPQGVAALARPGRTLHAVRELRADQYGLRTVLEVDGVAIKFEIVLEARIALAPPGPQDQVLGVATLTPLDMAATKLLALSDRWRDDAAMSRDLIDLAMLPLTKAQRLEALTKAEAAYGTSVREDLDKAIEDLRERPHRLDLCMQAMAMRGLSKAALWSRIRALAP